MKHFVTYLVLGILFVSVESEAQRITLTETKTNTQQIHIRNLLIVGSGATTTRAFLELLSSNLISSLKDKNVDAEYYFQPADATQATNASKQLLADSFDAILEFKPMDSSQYSQTVSRRKNDIIRLFPQRQTYPTYSRSVYFKENFDIQLYTPKNRTTLIWAATLDLYCDLSKMTQINRITDKLLSSLKANKVIR
jgi:hypothetical protein